MKLNKLTYEIETDRITGKQTITVVQGTNKTTLDIRVWQVLTKAIKNLL